MTIKRKWKIFLAYLFGWLSGLVLLLLEKRDGVVRYHAAQSLVVFLTLSILSTILKFKNFKSFCNRNKHLSSSNKFSWFSSMDLFPIRSNY